MKGPVSSDSTLCCGLHLCYKAVVSRRRSSSYLRTNSCDVRPWKLRGEVEMFFAGYAMFVVLVVSLIYFCQENRVLKTKKILSYTGNHNI